MFEVMHVFSSRWRQELLLGGILGAVLCSITFISCCVLCVASLNGAETEQAFSTETDKGNRLTYLDDFSNPYYPNLNFPKLVTPQWVGEEGVEAVITLGIDDMREVDRYEAYLRPILVCMTSCCTRR